MLDEMTEKLKASVLERSRLKENIIA